jgi:hypothetical protein
LEKCERRKRNLIFSLTGMTGVLHPMNAGVNGLVGNQY